MLTVIHRPVGQDNFPAQILFFLPRNFLILYYILQWMYLHSFSILSCCGGIGETLTMRKYGKTVVAPRESPIFDRVIPIDYKLTAHGHLMISLQPSSTLLTREIQIKLTFL